MSDELKNQPYGLITDALRRHKATRAACEVARQEARLPDHDPQRLERIAAYARSGYFNLNFGTGVVAGLPEIPSEYWGK